MEEEVRSQPQSPQEVVCYSISEIKNDQPCFTDLERETDSSDEEEDDPSLNRVSWDQFLRFTKRGAVKSSYVLYPENSSPIRTIQRKKEQRPKMSGKPDDLHDINSDEAEYHMSKQKEEEQCTTAKEKKHEAAQPCALSGDNFQTAKQRNGAVAAGDKKVVLAKTEPTATKAHVVLPKPEGKPDRDNLDATESHLSKPSSWFVGKEREKKVVPPVEKENKNNHPDKKKPSRPGVIGRKSCKKTEKQLMRKQKRQNPEDANQQGAPKRNKLVHISRGATTAENGSSKTSEGIGNQRYNGLKTQEKNKKKSSKREKLVEGRKPDKTKEKNKNQNTDKENKQGSFKGEKLVQGRKPETIKKKRKSQKPIEDKEGPSKMSIHTSRGVAAAENGIAKTSEGIGNIAAKKDDCHIPPLRCKKTEQQPTLSKKRKQKRQKLKENQQASSIKQTNFATIETVMAEFVWIRTKNGSGEHAAFLLEQDEEKMLVKWTSTQEEVWLFKDENIVTKDSDRGGRRRGRR